MSEIEFTITTGEALTWKAEFITHEGQRIDAKSVQYIDELYILDGIEN